MSDFLPVSVTSSLPWIFGSQLHPDNSSISFNTQPTFHPHFPKGRTIVEGSDRSASETSGSPVATDMY